MNSKTFPVFRLKIDHLEVHEIFDTLTIFSDFCWTGVRPVLASKKVVVQINKYFMYFHLVNIVTNHWEYVFDPALSIEHGYDPNLSTPTTKMQASSSQYPEPCLKTNLIGAGLSSRAPRKITPPSRRGNSVGSHRGSHDSGRIGQYIG